MLHYWGGEGRKQASLRKNHQMTSSVARGGRGRGRPNSGKCSAPRRRLRGRMRGMGAVGRAHGRRSEWPQGSRRGPQGTPPRLKATPLEGTLLGDKRSDSPRSRLQGTCYNPSTPPPRPSRPSHLVLTFPRWHSYENAHFHGHRLKLHVYSTNVAFVTAFVNLSVTPQ